MRLIDVNTFERPNTANLDQRACPVPCTVMRSRRNHDVSSRLDFVARSIHRKAERTREHGDVFVVPVSVQRNGHFTDGAKTDDKVARVGQVPV